MHELLGAPGEPCATPHGEDATMDDWQDEALTRGRRWLPRLRVVSVAA